MGIGMASQLHSSEKITQKKNRKYNTPDSTDMKYHAQALAALKDSTFVFNTNQIIFNNGIRFHFEFIIFCVEFIISIFFHISDVQNLVLILF